MRRIARWLLLGTRRRRLHERLSRVLQRALGTRIRSGAAKGLRLKGGGTVGYQLGTSQPAVQDALVKHLRPGNTFYDVGAHVGFFTVLACRLVGPTGHVHSFEPVPQNVAALNTNLRANGFEQATAHPIAIADRDGNATMEGGRSLTARLSESGDLTVRTARVDSLNLDAPQLVKIDVEGAESAVLRGMTDTLRAYRPVVVVEVHDDQERPVLELLHGHGYRTTPLRDGGVPHILGWPA
jgi:FkbM family methyltransferase